MVCFSFCHHTSTYVTSPLPPFFFLCSLHIPVLKLKLPSLPLTLNHSTSYYRCNAGYLGYTSGFSLSCMVFFLISVSLNYCQSSCKVWKMLSHRDLKRLDMLEFKYTPGFSIWCFISTFNHVNQKTFYIWNENILWV